MERQVQIDGQPVDAYGVTITGSDVITPADAKHLAYGDEVLVVVRARVQVPRLRESRKGMVTRVNVLAIKEVAVVRSDQLKKHLCEALDIEAIPTEFELEGLVPEVNSSGGAEPPTEPAFEPEVSPELEEPDPVIERIPVSIGSLKDATLAAFLDTP